MKRTRKNTKTWIKDEAENIICNLKLTKWQKPRTIVPIRTSIQQQHVFITVPLSSRSVEIRLGFIVRRFSHRIISSKKNKMSSNIFCLSFSKHEVHHGNSDVMVKTPEVLPSTLRTQADSYREKRLALFCKKNSQY